MPWDQVMSEFKKGSLHSGKGGKVVKKKKQAIAIMLSEKAKAHEGQYSAKKGLKAKKPMPERAREPKPWDTPIGGGPSPIRPHPGAGAEAASPPSSTSDDAFAQAERLRKQRDVFKNFIPEGLWNR